MHKNSGFGPFATIGELRAILKDLPDEMLVFFDATDVSEDMLDGALTESCLRRHGTLTTEAHARGLEDDPLDQQFLTISPQAVQYR